MTLVKTHGGDYDDIETSNIKTSQYNLLESWESEKQKSLEAAVEATEPSTDFSHVLFVHVVSAKALPAMDANGTLLSFLSHLASVKCFLYIGFSDPYVKVKVGSQKKRTAIVKKSLTPEWDTTLQFGLDGMPSLSLFFFDAIVPLLTTSLCLEDDASTEVFVEVYDWDRNLNDDFIGCYEVKLRSAQNWLSS